MRAAFSICKNVRRTRALDGLRRVSNSGKFSQLPNRTQQYTPFQVNQIRSFSKKAKSTEHHQPNDNNTDLIAASSVGDLDRVKQLVEGGVSVSHSDYDFRTPLHLAAAGGHLEVVKFLVDNGADVTAVDRWGSSVLNDAVSNGKDEVIKYLRSVGSHAKSDKGLTRAMCTAAAEGNVELIRKLIEAGVDPNVTDSDGRTPLHIACAKASNVAVDFLMTCGARLNVSDNFGNTPLNYAQRGDSKSKREIIRKLQLAGAKSEPEAWSIRNNHEIHATLQTCLPLLSERGGWIYSEAWIPSDDETELLPSSEWWADKKYESQLATFRNVDVSYKPGQGLVGSCWQGRTSVVLEEISSSQLGHHHSMVELVGLQSGLAVPIKYNDSVIAVLVFFSVEKKDHDFTSIDSFSKYANGLVLSGVFSKEIKFDIPEGSSPAIPDKVPAIFEAIVAKGVFNPKHIYQEVDWFFRMGIPPVYFEMFEAPVIANHIHCLMAAKKLAQAMARPEAIYVHTETDSEYLFMCPATYNDSVTVEHQIEQIIDTKLPENQSISLTYLCSSGTSLPNGKTRLSMYILSATPYVESNVDENESNIWKVASQSFLRTKTMEVRNRYQHILNEAVGNLAPTVQVHEISKDGTIPVTIALRHSHKASFLQRFTEALKVLKLQVSRKFMEYFANGIVIYSFYLKTSNRKEVDAFLHQAKLLSIVPGASLISTLLDGSLTVEGYTYAATVRRFCYYFLNQRSEEFVVLAEALKGDTLNLNRLNFLQTKLRKEAVSMSRISDCIKDHAPLVAKIFEDFERCCRVSPSYNTDLSTEIQKNCSELDAQILTSFLTFNAHIRKTNFWKPEKSSLSFSLDPSFVVETSLYPDNPFCIFFVVGQEFQGFHIRFRDVARGGIRVIKSSNKVAFLKNQENLFAENYDLAYTQNKKNKDIPEFGSKGTILLFRHAQGKVFVAFRKYISGLLDLLVYDPNDKTIVDHYKREEILFLGPDEHTADLMEWAARYAGTRGYRYWKAFTTGKSPSLGGVPHDTYGMTTQSVHRYVVGCLDKLGLKEEEVTKFMTGGPDGDLGSNEILLSKDKTIGIVDGSGVIYDPNGLDREELVRLAHARQTISNFNLAKLSSGGFRVLINDSNVTLPHGEVVESGLVFRNEFHLHPLSAATLFVPCGGRPASIHFGNVHKFFDSKGKPKSRIIVEGANLFLTQDARLTLEKAGVVLYKDASANKGGVTSSSLEVLAALVMTDPEHSEHMQVKDAANPPSFYQEYVKQIQQIIQNNAQLEFEAIWREQEITGLPRCVLTDKISEKINQLNDQISASSLYEKSELRNKIMGLAIPKKLQELVPLETIVERLPSAYGRAIFGAYLASHFVYKYGLSPSEFAFFEFLNKHE